MADTNFTKIVDGINLVPKTSSTSSVEGDIDYDSTAHKFNLYNGTSATPIVGESYTQTLTNKTLSGNTATNLISGSGTLTLNTTGTVTVPNATDTLVGKATTDTLTNKTLNGNTATNLISGSGTLTLNTSGTVTLPNATDTLVGKATTDTLTNKTLTSPIIATIVNTGTLTLPTSTDTLVGRATTDTLTNKTLSGNTATNLISGSGTLTLNTSGTITVPNGTDTLVGKATTDTLVNKTLDNTSTITIKDANFTIQDDGDITKQAKFQASGITAGQTRTLTIPDASVTINLGTNINSGAATNGQFLTANGSAGSTWTTASSNLVDPAALLNYSIVGSVAANAMTIALKDNAGSDPSSGSPNKFSFRNATIATGDSTQISVTAATSVVIPSGATLGHVDGNTTGQYIYVWALNNAGTVELGVSGDRAFDETSTQNSTTIGAGSTSHGIIYSTTGRTGVAVRLLGRILSKQVTAGTYLTSPSAISLTSGTTWAETTIEIEDSANFSFDGFGTTSLGAVYTSRRGNKYIVRGFFQAGTTDATTAAITIPSSLKIDNNLFSTQVSGQIVGQWNSFSGSSKTQGTDNGGVLWYDGAETARVFYSLNLTNAGYTKVSANAFAANTKQNTFYFEVPIAQYRSY